MQPLRLLRITWFLPAVGLLLAGGAGNTEAARAIAFRGVHVVPMDAERVARDQTVVVQDGRITAVGSSETVAIPEGAEIIEAAGKYLMPGLADMHTHLTGEAPFVAGAAQLPHYIAAGVTTIRLLSAAPGGLALRDEIAAGKRVGPAIYTSGPTVVGMPKFLFLERYKLAAVVAVLCVLALGLLWLVASLVLRGPREQAWVRIRRYRRVSLVGAAAIGVVLVTTKVVPVNLAVSRLYPWVQVVESAGDARAAVRAQARDGYDLVKVYDYLTETTARAALDEAGVQGMYTVGHIPDDVSLETLLDAGLREVAHVDELMERHMVGSITAHGRFTPVPFRHETIPQTVELFRSHDAFVVSNLVADEVAYEMLESPEAWLRRPEYAHLPESARKQWLTEGRVIRWKGQQEWRRNTMQPFLKTMVKALSDAGVKLLVGTDVSVEGVVPAHLHRDLEILVEAGLTPYQALEAATRNAAASVARMGRDGSFGTVEVGKRADLLLLGENPLENVSATRNRVGVMVHGRWFTQEALNDLAASPTGG